MDDNIDLLLSEVPRQLGAAARSLRPDLVYSYLFRNPALSDGVALFHADHGNLNTSSGLADATLGTAMQTISTQKDGPIALNLRGDYLIVPTALERVAGKLIRDVWVGDANATRSPILRSDSRLDNGLVDPTDGTGATIHAGDQTTWYMSTAGRHTLEVEYLAGRNKAPEIRQHLITRGSFGVAFDVRHFLSLLAVDHRGICKNTA